ncbi:MAG: hypothetical protein ABSA82_03180 [Thermacetogeniaceae bacterium]|jgi:hypothetical protein
MTGLIRLADVPEYTPRGVRIVAGEILCSTCGKPADTLHLVLDGNSGHYLKAGCEDHDPGGYWFTVKDLTERFEEWLPHLAEKRGNMLEALITGLGEDGLKLILQMRCCSR